MWDKLMKTSAPRQELMTCTLRDRAVHLDAELTETVNDRLTLDEVLRTPVHVEVLPIPATQEKSSA